MISKYFKDFDKKVVKKKKPMSSRIRAKAKACTNRPWMLNIYRDMLAGVIPSHLIIDAVKPIDSAGFSPDGVDLVTYDKYCRDIIDLMGGYVPYELVYGMFHVVQNLNKDSLIDVLSKIATAKKLNMYAITRKERKGSHIPSFAVVASSKYEFKELKNDIINFYLSKNIEYQYEIDILMVMHKGIVVKNWREKRSFIALETNEDTFMWFFILMNEYLDVKKDRAIDFRNYVKKEIIYNEY